ncbi:peptide chain release factor N(5)-glutamine methyltransferase [Candidatus Pantoea carbekii]|uniref:Release factor glutamine methyltransferase n=1 Tax=Candidatus Pantoea carbekii TaxID=1235990 RepID=U3U890_9GAMM|nr:peptide chain release factor N(5)-glutamine methyltransferase [Candidatus Pantoea carbekii]AKC32036.1 protein methyltransferase HemK [Candidatus Pantoea carbekii]BAO00559.1 HemK protein [Candidatus Pantoea carbekii]
MDIRLWKKRAVAALYNSDSAKRDVEILLSYVTGKERSWLIAFDDSILSSEQLAYLDVMLTRRIKGEPIAYLVGKREFWSLSLQVSSATIIPRPDTEIVVEQALACLPLTPSCLLDLGTGTGAIALALASERTDCQVIGCDRIADAITLARYNAKILDINNVLFQVSHWFNNICPQYFEIIVSNPPYINSQDPFLKQGDVRFEPISALVADEEGLADLREIISASPKWLNTKGWLVLEHGWQQGECVRNMMLKKGYQFINTVNDYNGNPRVTLGQMI